MTSTVMSEAKKLVIPEGYKMNAKGNLVALGNIKALDSIRDEEVVEMVAQARQMQQTMLKFKNDIYDKFEDFVSLSFSEYGVKWGGNKGNISLTSFDGTLKVQMTVGERISFDERLQAAKSLIDDYLRDLTEDSKDEVKTFILQAFEVDKAGKISTAKVLSLTHYDIDNPRWLKAIDAIKDSIVVTGSKSYLRFYMRENGSAKWQVIPLDMAAL